MNYQIKIEYFEGSPLSLVKRLYIESFKLNAISDLPKMKDLCEVMHDNKDLKMFAQDHAIE